MTYVFKVIFILFTFILLASSVTNDENVTFSLKLNELTVLKNIEELKKGSFYAKDIEVIDKLIYNIIYYSLEDSIVNKCLLNRNDIAELIETIAIFESSIYTTKGSMPFKSPLFIESNNAFGVKGEGHKAKTIEYINNERIIIYSSFKKYSSFEDSIKDVLLLLYNKYELSKVSTVEKMFLNMKLLNYFTAGDIYLEALNNVYKRIHKIERDDYIL